MGSNSFICVTVARMGRRSLCRYRTFYLLHLSVSYVPFNIVFYKEICSIIIDVYLLFEVAVKFKGLSYKNFISSS